MHANAARTRARNARTGRYGADPSEAWPVDYILGPDATDYAVLQSGTTNSSTSTGTGTSTRVGMAVGDTGCMEVRKGRAKLPGGLKTLW